MAFEWEPVELYGPNRDGEQRRYTIAAGTQVSIGTLMALTDNRTVTKLDGTFSAVVPVVAGIAAEEHEADKGVTTISCWTDGLFLGYGSWAHAVGGPCVAAGYNHFIVSSAITVFGSGTIFGKLMENSVDGAQSEVRVGPL